MLHFILVPWLHWTSPFEWLSWEFTNMTKRSQQFLRVFGTLFQFCLGAVPCFFGPGDIFI